jgi:serine phosphatase RsbU (regulator of sigma subunit)/anti-sigma regulatory factor (Ser/Thr protein kinase)
MQSGDRTQERLALLVRAGEMFHRSLEVEETLYNVARMAVESFADLCLFDLLDEHSDRLYVTAGAHRDAEVEATLKNVGSSVLYPERGLHPAVRVAKTGEPFFVPVLDEETILLHATSPQHAAFMHAMGYRSKIVVPVVSQSRIFGALTFVRTEGAEPFDESDVRAAEELGRRAGIAVANAKQYHREQHIAATLQRAFLSQQFPSRPRLRFHALYRPGMSEADLGGDWYDAFETRDGSIVMTIGDVTGKGIEAARLMVQLRQSVRVAATFTRDPSEILRIVNEALILDRSDALATAFVGVIEPGASTLRYASAGHPPAFVRWEHGGVEKLAAASPPLGISVDLAFETSSLSIDDDAGLLVLYTDGITEATRDVIAGEEMLRTVLDSEASLFAANSARFIQRAIACEDPRDDIAIMTLRFGHRERRWGFDVGDSSAAYVIKRDLLRSIAKTSEARERELNACEVILSELIGNAVRHAPGPLSLSLSVEGEDLFLHMIDEGPGFDLNPRLPDDLWSEGGRGLFLIAELSHGMVVSRLPGYGSYVRVRLPVHVDEPAAEAIPLLAAGVSV